MLPATGKAANVTHPNGVAVALFYDPFTFPHPPSSNHLSSRRLIHIQDVYKISRDRRLLLVISHLDLLRLRRAWISPFAQHKSGRPAVFTPHNHDYNLKFGHHFLPPDLPLFRSK